MVRNLVYYANKNKDTLLRSLNEIGYTTAEIEHTFFRINCFKMVKKTTQCQRQFQRLLNDIINEKSSITYILKESIYEFVETVDERRTANIKPHN